MVDNSQDFERAKALFFDGLELLQKKCYKEAERAFRASLAIIPDRESVLTNLVASLVKLEQFDEAKEISYKLLARNPSNREIALSLGNIEFKLANFQEALSYFNRCLEISLDNPEAWTCRGNTLSALGHLEDALSSVDKAIEINQDFSQAWSDRGNILCEMRRHEQAITSYNKSIDIDPNDADSRWNKALCELSLGNFDSGWELYEWRWKTESFSSTLRNFKEPKWLGREDISGKTIFIYTEQGLGDTIQFCRYVEFLKELGATVLLEVPRALMNLLVELKGVDELISKGNPIPYFDFHCPLLSLPYALRNTVKAIPNKSPYLTIHNQLVQKWKNYFGNEGFTIAICWQGNPKAKIDRGRSFTVDSFLPIAELENVRLISLQKGFGAEQLEHSKLVNQVETLADDFDSDNRRFLDSAAVMKSVDLVITSDTALTHVAGSLGIETWLPLRYVPDWRWLLNGNSSPWYPHHRLFRQPRAGDWESVFKQMAKEISGRIGRKR